MDLCRFESLIGKDNLSKVKSLNILIVGLGGVGGYTLESLVRCGVETISVCDYDVVDSSNINRQILANSSNIGSLKTNEAYNRYIKINSDLKLTTINNKIDEDTINDIDFNSFDYVVDACDDVLAKTLIINRALSSNTKIISSMGTAKKMDATKIIITTLNKTSYDPLAKRMRKLIDKDKQKKVVVVTSLEKAKDINVLGSNSFVPATAGLFITNYIINDVIK